MLLAIREKRFVKRMAKRMLSSYSAVRAENPDLSNLALYRAVLLHTQLVDPSHVDRILQQANDSVDLWTTGAAETMEFRQVVHFFAMSQYSAEGHTGTVVSFRDIVYTLVPAKY
jgi:hypothetical protein